MPAPPSLANCPVAHALALIGDRWTLLILRDLALNPSRRFQDFQESLQGCAPNTLSSRLKSMEENGMVARRQYAEHPPRFEYLLTEKGHGARPVLKALRSWGAELQSSSAEADDTPAAS